MHPANLTFAEKAWLETVRGSFPGLGERHLSTGYTNMFAVNPTSTTLRPCWSGTRSGIMHVRPTGFTYWTHALHVINEMENEVPCCDVE